MFDPFSRSSAFVLRFKEVVQGASCGLRGVELLTTLAEKTPAVRFAEVRLDERNLATRAYALGMCQPMLFENEGFLPRQEFETVLPRLLHQFPQFGGGQGANGGEWMHADAEQHFV